MTKKELYNTIEKMKEDNLSLMEDNKKLLDQREALVEENLRLTDHKDLKEEIITALGENILKSLKAKNIINMKPDEKDALYYMLERFMQLSAKADVQSARDKYLRGCMNLCN